jgi:mono/diheme cytochrome c family protein
MSGRVTGSLMGCGLLMFCVVGLAQKEDPRPEAVHLIESIQGPELYKAYCAVCHGKDGKGDGPMASSLKVTVADLTHIAARNHGKFPAARVEKIISGEEQLPKGHGTQTMPVWGPVFSQIAWDQDLGKLRIYNLAKHIEKMQVK